jgi:hypothetical protein
MAARIRVVRHQRLAGSDSVAAEYTVLMNRCSRNALHSIERGFLTIVCRLATRKKMGGPLRLPLFRAPEPFLNLVPHVLHFLLVGIRTLAR